MNGIFLLFLCVAYGCHSGGCSPTPPRSIRPAPLLANERLILDDLKRVFEKKPLVTDPNLIMTTYNSIWRNVLLDVNLLFEEHFQLLIEDDVYFDQAAQQVVEFIHANVPMQSIRGMLSISPQLNNSRASRISWLRDYLTTTTPFPSEDTLATWRLKDWQALQVEQSAKLLYVKLLKQLVTQYPYYGGSTEYMFGETTDLEFWVYHMSSMTKDPDRVISGSQLPKPLQDYRTYSVGKLPLHNQRNLGTGMTECNWSDMPQNLRATIVDILTDQHSKAKVDIYHVSREPAFLNAVRKWRDTVGPSESDVAALWNSLDEFSRMILYGDVLLLPWSDAHLYNGHGDYNVVGVRGSILEVPEKAGIRYQNDLDTKFPLSTEVPPNTFMQDDQYVPTSLPKTSLVNAFVKAHRDWYNAAYDLCLPIMQGISGHTLGYLNLYAAAIKANASFPIPMDVMRAIMMGGLIGTKRHHSYDEVLSASVGMPDGKGGKLSYNQQGFYSDVLRSTHNHIKDAATSALAKLVSDIHSPPTNSALYLLKKRSSRTYQFAAPIILDYVKGKADVASTLKKLERLAMM